MIKKLSLFVFTILCIFSFTSASRAETFTAYLSSAQEVPVNASAAMGYARIFVNEAALTIQYTIVFNNLQGTQNGAHIHAPAAIGANAGIAIGFPNIGGTSGTISGTTTITALQISQLRQHLGYVNVHSTVFPGGEIRGQLGVQRPVDNDGDGRTDFSVMRFPTVTPPGIEPITYWNLNSTGGQQVVVWGNGNRDFPAPGDFDGDGITDFSVYREGITGSPQSEFWILRSSDNNVQYFAWGVDNDLPVARDFDGDGTTDVAVFRRGAAGAPAVWYILQSATGTVRIAAFGTAGVGANNQDFPVPGDYDGDGKFDLAVYRAGTLTPTNTYIVLRSSDGVITYQPFGNFVTDYILPGDYDGDGKFDYAVARTGTASSPLIWWIMQSSNGAVRIQHFGLSSDRGVQGDYDGDARTDLAIYRSGVAGAQAFFWVLRSFDNTVQVTPWGRGGPTSIGSTNLVSDFPTATFDSR